MKIKKAVALSTVIGVALAGLAIGAPASADPVSNGYVAVGSDTLQDSMNALTNGTRITGSFVRIVSNNIAIGNFDAFPANAIQTKPGGPYFARPSGSGSGINALRTSINASATWSVSGNATPAVRIDNQVDIARSSSGPGTNVALTTGKLVYIPYARDAVAYAYKGGTAAWANLTAADLKGIYDGTTTSIDGVAVKPRLPQSTSGTRNFFLNALGYTGSSPATPAGVTTVETSTPENDASVLGAGEIIPFSVASWVAQANGATAINTTGAAGVNLGSAVSGQVPFTGTAPALVPSSAYYSNTTFGRDTYLIVEYARIDSTDAKYDANLANLVDSSKTTSLTNFSTALAGQPGSVKLKFGFLAPSTTTTQRAYATL